MRILIIEDSPTDRELLLFILEERFHKEAKFRTAGTLKAAFGYLDRGDTDCIILDLTLPDSAGKETFERITERYPSIPVIVMTHNKDRDLAIEMIQRGAADYILKDFTNEEDIFRRVLFAIEKHNTTVRVPAEEAASFHKLDKAQAELKSASDSGQHKAVDRLTVETTNAVASVSKLMFTEIQKISKKLERHAAKTDTIGVSVEELKTEIRGGGDRPSMRAQLQLVNHRIGEIESDLKAEEDRASQIEIAEKEAAVHIKTTKWSLQVKIIVALLGLLGAGATIAGTWYVTKMQIESGVVPK